MPAPSGYVTFAGLQAQVVAVVPQASKKKILTIIDTHNIPSHGYPPDRKDQRFAPEDVQRIIRALQQLYAERDRLRPDAIASAAALA